MTRRFLGNILNIVYAYNEKHEYENGAIQYQYCVPGKAHGNEVVSHTKLPESGIGYLKK